MLSQTLQINQQANSTVWDLVQDKQGYTHILYSRPSRADEQEPGRGFAYYSRTDKHGNTISDERIRNQSFSLEDAHLILNARDEAIIVLADMYSSLLLQFDRDGKIRNKRQGIPSAGVCLTDAGIISLFKGAWFAMINQNGDFIRGEFNPRRPFSFRTYSAVQYLEHDQYLVAWNQNNGDKKDDDSMTSFAIVDSKGRYITPMTKVNLKDAEAAISGIQFQSNPVLTRSNNGLFLFVGERNTIYRLRFSSRGELTKPKTLEPMRLLMLSEFSVTGRDIRLGKIRGDYTDREAEAYFYGFSPDGNMYYEKSATKLKLQK
jgi:hypothetical protein